VDRSRHRQSLQNARDVQDAVRSVVPPHSLIAADPGWSLVLPAVHLVRVMAQDLHHANPADGGLLERYADARELLAPDTDSQRRREIVAKHGVDFIVVHEPAAPADQNRFDDVGDLVSSQHGFHVVRIRH
jgi:hypothetical protein